MLRRINERRDLYMISGKVLGRAMIRFVVCSRLTDAADVRRSWTTIVSHAEAVLRAEQAEHADSLVRPLQQQLHLPKTASVVHSMLGAAPTGADAQHTV